MRFILAVLCLSLCVPALASGQSIPMPYDPADWENGTEQDRLYIGAFEVLDDIVSNFQLFHEFDGDPMAVQGGLDGLEEQYQFALIVGRWREHLKTDLDAYLALNPPGKYADRARELRGALTEEHVPYFIGNDDPSPTTVEKLVTFYRDWIASDVRAVQSVGKSQNSQIRTKTILRWAKEDGFIHDGEYHQYLQDIQ